MHSQAWRPTNASFLNFPSPSRSLGRPERSISGLQKHRLLQPSRPGGCERGAEGRREGVSEGGREGARECISGNPSSWRIRVTCSRTRDQGASRHFCRNPSPPQSLFDLLLSRLFFLIKLFLAGLSETFPFKDGEGSVSSFPPDRGSFR